MTEIETENESGIQPGIITRPKNAMFTDMVELFWTLNDGRNLLSVWPRETAEEFLSKHLIPQKDQGLIIDAGIRELGQVGSI